MRPVACGDMAAKVNVVVHVAQSLITNTGSRVTEVPDKLPLGHFVLDVGTGEVHAQQDERVADHIQTICRKRWGSIEHLCTERAHLELLKAFLN